MARQMQALQDADNLKSAVEASKTSKTAGRDRALFDKLVDELGLESDAAEASFDLDVWIDGWAEEGIDPLDAARAVMPGEGDARMKEALETGSFKMPLSALTKFLGTTENADAWISKVRLRPNGGGRGLRRLL